MWERQWHCSEDEMKEYLAQSRIYFGPAPKYESVPRLKIRPTDEEEVIPPNIFDEAGTTRQATKYLDDLFGIKGLFENPKPVKLIKDLIELSTSDQDIVLDSCAGSGTTAEAVMELNKEEGNRKFILVQLPEEIKKDAPAYQAGFRWIHEITRGRIKRVIEKNK